MGFDIEGYVRDNLSKVMDSSNGELTALCPECEAGGGKFYVNKKTGRFICFKCDFRGSNFAAIIAKVEGISFRKAREFIFRNTVVFAKREDYWRIEEIFRDFKADAGLEEEDPEPVDFGAPRTTVPCWDGKRWRFPKWLKTRGIKRQTARAWGLGFVRIHERYAGRLIIPIECPGGRSFTARDMTGEQEPKYLNPKGADHRRLLIGWHVMPDTGSVVLCEGPFDALKLWQHSFSALAVGGKELHAEQLAMLKALGSGTRITIMLDGEEHVAPEKMATRLGFFFKRIQIAQLPYKVDPGDATYQQISEAIIEAKRWKRKSIVSRTDRFEEFKERFNANG